MAEEMGKATLDTMPEEVKEVWKRAEETGLFDSFSVTVSGGGDPLLVGNIGRVHFFLAGWLPIGGGHSFGVRIKLPGYGGL